MSTLNFTTISGQCILLLNSFFCISASYFSMLQCSFCFESLISLLWIILKFKLNFEWNAMMSEEIHIKKNWWFQGLLREWGQEYIKRLRNAPTLKNWDSPPSCSKYLCHSMGDNAIILWPCLETFSRSLFKLRYYKGTQRKCIIHNCCMCDCQEILVSLTVDFRLL